MEDEKELKEQQPPADDAENPAKEAAPTEEPESAPSGAEGQEPESQQAGLSVEAVKQVVLDLLTELGLVQATGAGQPMQMGAKLNGLVKAQTNPLATRLDDLQKQLVLAEKGLLKMQADELQKALDGQKTNLDDLRKTIAGDIAQGAIALDTLEKRGGPGPVIRDLGAISPNAMAEMQKSAVLKDLLKDATDPQTRQALQTEITRLEIKAVQTSK